MRNSFIIFSTGEKDLRVSGHISGYEINNCLVLSAPSARMPFSRSLNVICNAFGVSDSSVLKMLFFISKDFRGYVRNIAIDFIDA